MRPAHPPHRGPSFDRDLGVAMVPQTGSMPEQYWHIEPECPSHRPASVDEVRQKYLRREAPHLSRYLAAYKRQKRLSEERGAQNLSHWLQQSYCEPRDCLRPPQAHRQHGRTLRGDWFPCSRTARLPPGWDNRPRSAFKLTLPGSGALQTWSEPITSPAETPKGAWH